MHLVHL